MERLVDGMAGDWPLPPETLRAKMQFDELLINWRENGAGMRQDFTRGLGLRIRKQSVTARGAAARVSP